MAPLRQLLSQSSLRVPSLLASLEEALTDRLSNIRSMTVIDTKTLLSHSLANLVAARTSEQSRRRADPSRTLIRRLADRLVDARRSKAQLLVEQQLLAYGSGLDILIQRQ